MERHFQNQVDRVDRLMALIRVADFSAAVNHALTFYDVTILTCQAMWHLKDWVLNDTEFRPANRLDLQREIHRAHVLLVCADIANGSKHLSLKAPRIGTGVALSAQSGIHVEPAKGIFREFYYVLCPDCGDPYYGAEIRQVLEDAQATWRRIIDDHYLSEVTASA